MQLTVWLASQSTAFNNACLGSAPYRTYPPLCPIPLPHYRYRPAPQVLLFCTQTRALDVIEEYLDWRGFEFCRLDGATAAGERGELIRDFNRPGGWALSGTLYPGPPAIPVTNSESSCAA